MPNTKSAERRVRSTARRQEINRRTKSRLKTLESGFLATIQEGNKAAAVTALRDVTSALDKASKNGVIHRATANRKKSRLSLRLTALK